MFVWTVINDSESAQSTQQQHHREIIFFLFCGCCLINTSTVCTCQWNRRPCEGDESLKHEHTPKMIQPYKRLRCKKVYTEKDQMSTLKRTKEAPSVYTVLQRRPSFCEDWPCSPEEVCEMNWTMRDTCLAWRTEYTERATWFSSTAVLLGGGVLYMYVYLISVPRYLSASSHPSDSIWYSE